MRIWRKGVCSDVARCVAIRHRGVVKTIGSHRWEARGVAWYAHGGGHGRHLGRNAKRNEIPANARL